MIRRISYFTWPDDMHRLEAQRMVAAIAAIMLSPLLIVLLPVKSGNDVDPIWRGIIAVAYLAIVGWACYLHFYGPPAKLWRQRKGEFDNLCLAEQAKVRAVPFPITHMAVCWLGGYEYKPGEFLALKVQANGGEIACKVPIAVALAAGYDQNRPPLSVTFPQAAYDSSGHLSLKEFREVHFSW